MAASVAYRRFWLTFRSTQSRLYVSQRIISAPSLLMAEERAKTLLWTRRLTEHDGARWDGWTLATATGPHGLPKVVAYGDQFGTIHTLRDHDQAG